MVSTWTPKRLELAKKILSKHDTIKPAIRDISSALGFKCTVGMLRGAFERANSSPGAFLKKTAEDEANKFTRLVELVKKPVAFSELCNRLDMSPSRAKELILDARAEGIKIHVESDHVGLKFAEPLERVQATKISPVVGKRQKIGVISDTHLGSKYCLRDQLKEFVLYAYSQGVREILHPGDVLDGDYGHGKFEMTHMGIDAQCRDLFETLPALPGLTYHGITGNHDNTFTEKTGVDAGEFIASYFAKRGRRDFTFYGNRGAFLKIRGAVVHLWHPRSGGAYAISYPLQKKIEGYSSLKPQILLAGHWHRFTSCDERGVHAIACPTFQAGRSAFSKSLTGAPAIGGLILSWDLTRDGTMRTFALERRTYFEVERPIDVYNGIDGFPVDVPSDEDHPRRR